MKPVYLILFLLPLSFVSGQSLESLIEKAKSHPRYQSHDARIEGTYLEEKARTAWQDPQLQMGIGVFPIETRVGPQVLRLGIRQNIPFPAAQRAKREEVQAMRTVYNEDQELTFRELKYQIQLNYLDYFVFHHKESFYRQFLTIYDQIREDRVRNMQRQMGHYSDVLVVDRMIHQTKRALEKTKYQKDRALIAISYWSGAALKDSLKLETDFPIEGLRLVDSLEFIQNPTLQKIEAERNLWLARQEQVSASKWPGLQLGLEYLVNTPRTDHETPNNGRDGLIPSIGVSVPLSGRYYQNRLQSQEKELEVLDLQFNDQKNWITQQFLQARNLQVEAGEDHLFYAEQIDRTEEILDLIEIEISSDHTRFLEYWDYQKQMLEYQLQQLESKRQWYQAAFLIEKLQTD